MRNVLFILLVFCCPISFANNLQKPDVGRRQGGFINTFYQMVAKTTDKNKNFLFSPVSVKLSMGMLLNGANEKTKKEFLHALNYEGLSLADINSYNHKFMMRTSDSSSVNKLIIANSLWINSCKKANVRKKYIGLMSGSYMSDVQKRNFCKDLALVENEMRQWVNERTNGFLNFSPEVKAEDAMVGINTVYFKGQWDEPPITPSQPQPFYNRYGSTADCIYLKYSRKCMPYFGNRYFRAVKLFYKNADYSMIVVLPQRNLKNTGAETLAMATSDTVLGQKTQLFENKGLSNYQLNRNPLESQFSIAEKLKRNKEMRFCQNYGLKSENVVTESPLYKSPFPNRTYRRELKDFMDVDSILSHIEWENLNFSDVTFDEVRVPHFETENSIDLKPILADMGVPSIFMPDANSLSQIADSLYVSNYTQKAKIIVNEKGTEAAAATHWSLSLLSSSSVKHEPVTFIADRPFLYAICDERTGAILFVGRVVGLGK